MLSQTVQDAINERFNLEIYAANVYLSMASYCDSLSLPGFGHWMRAQFMEEIKHAMRVYKFLGARNAHAVVAHIEQPPIGFTGLANVFQKAYQHEQTVTRSYEALFEIVSKERDYVALQLVNWFMAEQAEEEEMTRLLADQATMAENDSAALLMLDRELAQRKEEELAA